MSRITFYQMYQISRRREQPHIELWGVVKGKPAGSNGGFFRPGQAYTLEDSVATLNWLAERAAGYPKLDRFKNGANYPEDTDYTRDFHGYPWSVKMRRIVSFGRLPSPIIIGGGVAI